MVTRDAGVDEPEITVGAPPEQGGRCDQVIVALLAAAAVGVVGRDDQPGAPGEITAARLRQVAGGLADLAAFHRGPANDAGPDSERAGGQVVDTLEPHAHRADE